MDLRFNELKTIPDNAFLDIFTLKAPNLNVNLIKKLPLNAFVSNMNMRYFDASYSEIKEFNDEMFRKTHNWKKLYYTVTRFKRFKRTLRSFVTWNSLV